MRDTSFILYIPHIDKFLVDPNMDGDTLTDCWRHDESLDITDINQIYEHLYRTPKYKISDYNEVIFAAIQDMGPDLIYIVPCNENRSTCYFIHAVTFPNWS